MPDWFYRTISRPILFQLPAARARDLALGVMGRIARVPGGSLLIDFLGHMRPDPRLGTSVAGLRCASSIGLAPWVDGRVAALPALKRFGFGFVEIGPVGGHVGGRIERREAERAFWLSDPPPMIGVPEAKRRLAEALGKKQIAEGLAPSASSPLSRSGGVGRTGGVEVEQVEYGPLVGARLWWDGAEVEKIRIDETVRELAPFTHFFTLQCPIIGTAEPPSTSWRDQLAAIVRAATKEGLARPVFLVVPATTPVEEMLPHLVEALAAGIAGFVIDGMLADPAGGYLLGADAFAAVLQQVRSVRLRLPGHVPLIAAGGVHDPEQALALKRSGADLVEIDTGLVYSGPGLPKRVNEALLFERTRLELKPARPKRWAEYSWFWTTLFGTGLIVGSVLAMGISLTRVVLPYDEAFVGMSRRQIDAVNPRLLAFMAHDRVSLAGAMLATGILYASWSIWGVRRGVHWARLAIFVSAFTGFATFFLFIGFGYLDPFHAFVTSVLMQMLFLAILAKPVVYIPEDAGTRRENPAWRRGLWGQLLLIGHGCGMIGAGLTICLIGVTDVFVTEDLMFMRTAADTMWNANDRLVPLIAHDRATLGGMLLADGWLFVLAPMWGFRARSPWLWWSLLTAGLAGYGAAIGVHFHVHYMNMMHLLPAFTGLAVFVTGMGLSKGFLCGEAESDATEKAAPDARGA